jgi:hypothetical protein
MNSILKLISDRIFTRTERVDPPEVSTESIYGYMHLRSADVTTTGPRNADLVNPNEETDRTSSSLEKQIQLCRS